MKKPNSSNKIDHPPRGVNVIPISLHGRLYYAYRKSVGWKLFTAAYWPTRFNNRTWILWIITFLLFALPFSSSIFHPAKISAAIISLLAVYYFAANSAIDCSFSKQLQMYGIVGDGQVQPHRLKRDILHYHWFHENVRNKIAPTLEHIELCIAFIDSNRKLAITNTFSRHPLVALAVGIPVFLLNSQITELLKKASSISSALVLICYCVFGLLYIIWIFHSSLHDGERDNWRFKRYLTWYSLHEFGRAPDSSTNV